MQRVLIDACGWVACIDAGMNIEHQLERLFGPCQWVLLEAVLNELKQLDAQRRGRSNLLLSMLEAKSIFVSKAEHGEGHTDDLLLHSAQSEPSAVLTVDVDLKRRLYDGNLPVVEVVKGSRLNLIDSL